MILHFEKNKVGRDIIVGDIHGCFRKLQTVLDERGFNPDVDRLFSVGDLVDRGPDSDLSLEWLSKPWFHAVQGNHEDMAIRWGKPGCMMDAGNYMANGGGWNIANTFDKRADFSFAFEALPVAIELETDDGLVVIIHASVPGTSWVKFKQDLQQSKDGPRWMEKDLRELALWDRTRIREGITTPIKDVRAVVCGHTPLKSVVVLGNVHHIDTAGWHPSGAGFTLYDAATLKAI